MKTYKTAHSFRAAIEERHSSISKTDGIDAQRLRRDVAFDRLLVRLFAMASPPWALKGGYAMQLRTDSARTTKDVDLALKDAKLFSSDAKKRILPGWLGRFLVNCRTANTISPAPVLPSLSVMERVNSARIPSLEAR